MAEYSDFSEITFRKYKLKNFDAYLYFLCFYYSAKEHPDFNNGILLDFRVTFDSIGYTNVQLPYWEITTGDGARTRTISFLSVYQDDLLHVYTDGDDYINFNLVKGTSSLLICRIHSSLNHDVPSFTGAYIKPFTVIFAIDTDSGNVTCYRDFTTLQYNMTASVNEITIDSFPTDGSKKGTFRPLPGVTVNQGNYLSLSSLNAYGALKFQNELNKLVNTTSKIRKLDPDDPNDGGGSSTGGGGGGDGNIGGDNNPDDDIPTVQATDSGLMTLYNPTTGDLQNLGRFLWSDQWSLDNFKKLFNDPFDTLLGLSVIPIKPNTSGSRNIMFGNLDSGVPAPVISSQWVTKNMGSLTLNEAWHGALDYAPSTGVSIYLPFIGMRQLNTNDVMGSTITLIYKFDVLTGTCIAQLYVNHNAQGNKTDGFSWSTDQGLLYEFQGQCSVNIPLSSQDYTNTIRAAISGVAVAAGAAASVATGNPALGIAGLAVGTVNTGIQANTPIVQRSGHLSGSASLLGYTQPFLVVERPHQCKPQRYYALRGIPSQVYVSKLAECTGFTQITDNNNIHASGAQDVELEEIEQLLSSGVYFPSKKRS